MVGYTYLSGVALEPIACKQDLDLTQWIEADPSIECDWCSNKRYAIYQGKETTPAMDGSGSFVGSFVGVLHDDDDESDMTLGVTYRAMATLGVMFFTLCEYH